MVQVYIHTYMYTLEHLIHIFRYLGIERQYKWHTHCYVEGTIRGLPLEQWLPIWLKEL